MTVGPESRFHNAVNKKLPSYVYAEKTNNPYRGGIPDYYYEGFRKILWVEYKWLAKIPPRVDRVSIKISALQEQWLLRAYKNKHPIAVIVGCEGGGGIFTDNTWITGVTRDVFKKNIKTRKEIAEWITKQLWR